MLGNGGELGFSLREQRRVCHRFRNVPDESYHRCLHEENVDSSHMLSITISPSASRCAHAAPAVKMGCAEACARGDQYYFDEFGQPEAQARPRLGLRDPHHACLLGRSHGQSVPLPEIPVATKPKQSEFIAPFWAVGVTQDIYAANMQKTSRMRMSSSTKPKTGSSKFQ